MTAAHSLSTVYRQHHAFVWRTLRCLGVTDAAVDDAVQDVFVVAHRKLDAFEGRSTLRTWLYEIARRVAWRHRQRAQADAARSFELPDLHAALDLDDAVARAQALEILRAFLDRLDEDKATVYVLTELGGLHGSEIAEALGINVNTVHARLRAARRELERMLVRLRARDRSGALPLPDRIAPMLVRERPSAAQQRHSWALLAAKLGLGRSTPWLGLGSSATSWVVAAAAVPLVAVAVSMGVGRAGDPPAPEPVKQSFHAGPHDDAPAPSEPSVAPPEPPAITPSPPPSSEKPPTRSPTRTDRRAIEPPADALRRELALVEAIRVARRNDTPRALELVARYHRAHPQGALASEVAALEIEALCAKGDLAAAGRAAERFAARWPESSLRAAFVGPCELASR
jgi:RNA polymerase sigma-70 factor, ECF subfamily